MQIVRVHGDGLMFPAKISAVLEDFAMLVIDHTIENCDAHSDSDIDKKGALINTYKQFGL